MNKVKSNFKTSYADLTCPLCRQYEDRDDHLLQCSKIKEKSTEIQLNISSKYIDIFSSSIEKMVSAIELLDIAMEIREKILEEQDQELNN